VLFFAMLALGMATATLQAVYLRALRDGEIRSLQSINSARVNVVYALSAFESVTAFDIAALAGVVYLVARRGGVEDKIMKTLLCYAVPLYSLLIVTDIVTVVIEISPVLGERLRKNTALFESVSIVLSVCYDVFFVAVGAVLIYVGLLGRPPSSKRRGDRGSGWVRAASTEAVRPEGVVEVRGAGASVQT